MLFWILDIYSKLNYSHILIGFFFFFWGGGYISIFKNRSIDINHSLLFY